MKGLRIPEKYKRTGLYVYCNKCKRYSNIKDGYLKPFPDCDHPYEKQVFKLKVHVEGTHRVCKTMALKTKDIQEVDKIRMEFIEQLKTSGYNLNNLNTDDAPDQVKYLLTYQMERYITFKTQGGFYDFEASRKVSKKTVDDFKRHFRYFLESTAGMVNLNTLRIDQITEIHLNAFFGYMNRKKFSPKSYNNMIASLRGFYNHMINNENLNINNPFLKMKQQTVYYDPVIFSQEEFEKILDYTTYENGYDSDWERNLFREWLPTAFKLGLYTCLRLGELVELKYEDVVLEDGILLLRVENQKVNKILGNNDQRNKRIKRIPVINELKKVFDQECSYDDKQGSNQYIIAPELSRNTVHGIITKGFTHFKRKAGIDESKCFKDLRTTYITKMESKYGLAMSSIVSDHSSTDVVQRHYLAQIESVKMMKGFRLFEDA